MTPGKAHCERGKLLAAKKPPTRREDHPAAPARRTDPMTTAAPRGHRQRGLRASIKRRPGGHRQQPQCSGGQTATDSNKRPAAARRPPTARTEQAAAPGPPTARPGGSWPSRGSPLPSRPKFRLRPGPLIESRSRRNDTASATPANRFPACPQTGIPVT